MYNSVYINKLNLGNKLSSFKKPYINFNKEIVIYGAGDMCKMALEFFDIYDIKINTIIDKKIKKINSKIVFNLEKLKNLNKESNICICIANKDFFIVYNYLRLKGFKNVFHFYEFSEKLRKKFYLSNGWYVNKNAKVGKLIKFCRNFFNDNLSIRFYLNFLTWHISREYIKDFKPHKEIYLNSITKRFFLKNRLLYLDIGTGYGKSLSKVLRKNYFKKVICIDGCGKVIKFLKNKYKSNNKVRILRKVISNKKKKLKFHEGLYHISKISKKGSIILSQSIDSLRMKPSVIKVHTEGEELNVLKGSIKTINLHKPLLMINIYHNSDGVIKIFNLMKNFRNNYKFYLRGYSSVGTNYVLYCVPR